ncbi:hypothetical protein FA13DRAFT_1090074 [Coprinellus micaceus]|uniref:Uncharacterized protein n=1 Tax=Coprinellus micaceus TaxID=71717 RepID=A0A4Y7TRT6_COPMI|nr:hypothetical protein FA13DRAFT_1090074 [Coprinellus micaceus]
MRRGRDDNSALRLTLVSSLRNMFTTNLVVQLRPFRPLSTVLRSLSLLISPLAYSLNSFVSSQPSKIWTIQPDRYHDFYHTAWASSPTVPSFTRRTNHTTDF